MVYLDIVPNDREVETPDPAISYNFPLDVFQKQAQHYIQKREHVLITAHTSAGKTVVAESAIAFAKKHNERVIYTSPIKTLSNQKFNEFQKKFGDVGLMTGDIKCSPDAQCVIMTTEILRDMLYKESHRETINQLKFVIFDEVHYINNPERGHVWEECLVKLPPHICLVMLSATISDADKFGEWIGQLRNQKVHLITTLKRPVPLNHYGYINDDLQLILDNRGNFHDENYHKYYQDYMNLTKKGGFNPLNLLNPFISFLKKNKMTPAIFFVFSRKKCEKYAGKVQVSLVDLKEQSLIRHEIDKYLSKHSTPKTILDKIPQVNQIRKYLEMGIGIHHSGLLPVLKEIVEILYGEGLIKVLFATETFAVGVNLPCKVVVFTELTKHCDGRDQPRLLKPDEYLQMSGRAGRRGLDVFGVVVHLPLTEIYDQTEVRSLLLGKSAKIDSKLKINYSFMFQMLMNGGDPHDPPNGGDPSFIIKKSYLSCQYGETIKHLQTNEKKQENELNQVLEKIKTFDIGLVEGIESLIKLETQLVSPLNNCVDGLGLVLKKNKSQDKKLRGEITELTEKLKVSFPLEKAELEQIIKNKQNLENQIRKLKEEINLYQTCLNEQYIDCLIEMSYMGYLNWPEDESSITGYIDAKLLSREHLSEKGVIASHIMSANAILITELIVENKLESLDLSSLASVLSLFCDHGGCVGSESTQQYPLPQNACDVIDWVYNKSEKYSRQYETYRVEFPEGCLSDTLTSVSYLWAQGKTYFEIYPYLEGYEGNFIRSLLRLSHICEEMINVCEIFPNATLEKKLRDLKEVIVRDIVSFDSLYLR